MVFVIGTGLILAFAFAHAMLRALFKELAPDQAMESLRGDICPCCDGPLPETGERFQRGVVCPACGGDWDPSGKIHVQGDVP